MPLPQTLPATSTPLSVPLHVDQWVGTQKLLQLSFDAIQSLDWTEPALARQPGQEFRPQMLMTLLTYSYAAGIYGSRDIELAAAVDPAVRYVCAHTRPDWARLRSFRRRNHELLVRCLTHVLQQAWAWKIDQGEISYSSYDEVAELLTQQLPTAARARVEAAAIMDRILSEDQ